MQTLPFFANSTYKEVELFNKKQGGNYEQF
jgi:hypothetical protein